MFEWIFGKKKIDKQKQKELEARLNGFDLNSSQKKEKAEKILSEIPDLSPRKIEKKFVLKLNGQPSKHHREEVLIFAPKVHFYSETSFSIQMAQESNPKAILNYSDFIGQLFRQNGLIESSRVIIQHTNNPYLFNFRILAEFESSGITSIQKQKKEYLAFINTKIKGSNAEIWLGDCTDESLILNSSSVIESLKSSPHIMVAGQTRSGKTKSMLSLIYQLSNKYPESIGHFYFGDGKSSPDYDLFAKKLSKFKVAKPFAGDDALIEFASLIKSVWSEYQSRQALFVELKDLGHSASTYLEMAQIAEKNHLDSKFKLPRKFIIIDEFASFVAQADDNINSLISTESSSFYYLSRLLRESASFGFTFIIGSQRVQATDFPPPIKSNLTCRLIHAVQQSDAKYLDMEGEVEKQKTGHFILNYPGLKCSVSGTNNIPCSLPYIGDNPDIDLPYLDQFDFDYDLIYPRTSKSASIDKLNRIELAKYLKTTILKREGFKIEKENNPTYEYIPFNLEFNSKFINFGIADIKEFVSDDFSRKLRTITAPEVINNQTVWFIMGDASSIKKIDEIKNIVNPSDIILFNSDYSRIINKALDLYNKNNTDPFFKSILNEEFKNSELKKEIKVKNNVIISVEVFKEMSKRVVKSDKEKAQKGQDFEDFMETILSINYHVWPSDFLFQNNLYKRNVGGMGDNGLDLLLIPKSDPNELKPDLRNLTYEQSKGRIIAQLKNWAEPINAKPVGELLRARNNFECLSNPQIEAQLMLISANGFTSPCISEASNSNVVLIESKMILKLISEFISSSDSNNEAETIEDKIRRLSSEGWSQRKIASEVKISLGKVNQILKGVPNDN